MFIELSITSVDFDLMNLPAGLTIFLIYWASEKIWKKFEKKFENVETLLKIANFLGETALNRGI